MKPVPMRKRDEEDSITEIKKKIKDTAGEKINAPRSVQLKRSRRRSRINRRTLHYLKDQKEDQG